jgi:hypothetical protein
MFVEQQVKQTQEQLFAGDILSVLHIVFMWCVKRKQAMSLYPYKGQHIIIGKEASYYYRKYIC